MGDLVAVVLVGILTGLLVGYWLTQRRRRSGTVDVSHIDGTKPMTKDFGPELERRKTEHGDCPYREMIMEYEDEVQRLRRQVELLKDDISACNIEIKELKDKYRRLKDLKRPPALSSEERQKRADQRDRGVLNDDSNEAGRWVRNDGEEET